MSRNSWVIPSLIGLGVLSVVLSLFVASQTEKQKPSVPPLALAQLNIGKVFILRKNMTQKEVLAQRSPLFALDSIETAADGDATLEFDSAYRIRIDENSLITLDDENEHAVLIIKRGDVQVENFGQEGSVFISRDGVRWNATDYEQNYKKQPPTQTLPDVVPSSESAAAGPPGKAEGGGLTSDFIQETLRLQRSAFFRCYTQLLQRTPGVVGQASISFTIERSGKVYNADIASSTINDAAFKKCLLEAIRRVEFKSFTGDAVSTVFPLKFE